MKKISLVIMLLLFTYAFAKPAPKMGCILAQQGKVIVNWTVYGEEKLGQEGKSSKVEFITIQKEGTNFHQILVGSSIKADFQGKPLLAKFLHIQSKKRIARGPRHGIIIFNMTLNAVSNDVPMVYFYEKGKMRMKGHINLKDFKLSDKDSYTELSFGLDIHSIVCAVK